MDPLTLGIGAIGLGMQLFGKFSGAEHAKEFSQLEQQQAGLEQQVNAQKKQQMEVNGRRQLLEVYRNTQRMRSQSLQAGVSQGAQFGSGVAGGQAQVTAQGSYNALGVNQNLEIGRNIFGINDQISGVKMKQASLKGEMASDQAWSSLGGSILSGAGTIGNVGQSLYAQAGFQANPYNSMPKAGINF